MSIDGRVRRALDGDDSLLVTRSVALDDIHIRAGGTGRDVVAYAAVWMSPAEVVDSEGHYREQNAPDAMNNSIAQRAGRIYSVYNHAKTLAGTPSELHSVPLGKPLEIRADKTGLLTVTRYNKDPEADRILEAIKSGSLTGMSYTGVFLRSDPQLRPYERYGPSHAGDLPLVTRLETALIEYGPTPNPTFADAAIVGVRNRRPQVEETEPQVEPLERETITVAARAEGAAEPTGDDAAEEAHDHVERAQMSAASINDLPDSAFAYIEPGGKKDSEGKTVPRELRHFPLHDEAHVRNALSRAPQSPFGDKAMPKIKAAAKKFGIKVSDDSTTSSSGRQPAPGHHRTEPHPHSAAPNNQNRSTSVENDRSTMTVEERVARQSEIRARLAELDTEYSGAELPQEARAEWNGLQQEMVVHERSIADANSRADYLRYINDTNPGATERVDNTHAGYGQDSGQGSGAGFQARMGTSGPGFHASRDIYDLAAIRNRARHIDEVPMLYREHAMRAVEAARYPGATGRNGLPSKEDAQTRIATLLDTIDDEHGTLARRILVTGSPLYDRAFGKMLGMQSVAGLTAEESRALSLGTDSAGGYAVPFQLDPTVILTSNGVVNPLRQIARVETITGKEWDGVSSAGVTVSRGTEGQEVGTGDPALAQPSVRTQRVQGFIPFSIELDVSWGALRTQMTALLQDAKDVEEATAFATGNGTAPNPNGVVSTLGSASWVDTAGSAVLAAADIYLLENAMAPRFIANSSIVAAKTTYNRFRTLFQAQASAAGDPFARPSGSMGPTFNGYPKYELSTMSTSIGTGSLIMLQGDFSRFLIVDRVGMGIELIPHLFGATNRYPTGQRGVLALWFNSSKILADNAFRLLRIKST
jgi:HK97 family phage major capsid protein/HK97 family phage prohead protease